MSYGRVQVSIPATHQAGFLEGPPLSLIRIRLLENPEKQVLLLGTSVLGRNAYFRQLNDRIVSSPRQDALIFIHGFNVDFSDAARRTAQISYDLGFTGVPVFYSWPSKGSPTPLGYTADESTIEWSRENIRAFLADFLASTQARRVYLVGHSMGTRALTAAFISLMNDTPRFRTTVKEVILAAPDIDAMVFRRDLAPAMAKIGVPVTLYASSRDRALKVSHEVSDVARAGDAGPGLVLAKGIETIDISEVDTDFLGHSTFAQSRDLLTDWQYIIDYDVRADQRPNLKAIGADGYWRFRH